MYRRIFSVIILVVLLFSLCACSKNEAPKDTPVTEPSEITPIAKDEPKEAPVKEFSDGRIYTEGDIVSFAETENYYFTLDKDASGLYISCFTKDGQLVKRAQPRGISIVLGNPTKEDLNQEVTFVPATDIYAVKNDSIVFGCAGGNNRYILMNSDFECDVITGMAFPDLNYYDAAFLKNDEGYYDVLTLGDTDLLYRFNSQRMTSTHNFEFLDYSDLSDIHNSYPQTAFRTEDGSYYSFGSIDVKDELLIFKQVPVVVKYSESLERVAYQVYSFEYNSIFEAKQAGDYIVFAQEVHNLYDDSYINRLIVLDKDLNELFYKDYDGGCPVEVQAVGKNLAVSVYKNGGDSSSYIEILDASGEDVTQISHSLSYARIYSDRSQGLYVSGKHGSNSVNTVLRHYSKDIELLDETVFETENDEDKGFGLYFEINNDGKAVALQGNIVNFPLYLKDKSSSENRFLNFENYFQTPIFTPPIKGDQGDQFALPETYKTHIFANGKYYTIFGTSDGDYLNAFNSNNERLWKIRITGYGDSLYYIDGIILTVWGNMINAFDGETGEQQWSMQLDDRVYAISDTIINNKVHIIVESDFEFGVCTVDAKGNWEYFHLPENTVNEPKYFDLKKDSVTGEMYCVFSGNQSTCITKLSEKFSLIDSYVLEDLTFKYFYADNGRVYITTQKREEDNIKYYLNVFDSELNLINTMELERPADFINTVGNTGIALLINGSTYLADIDGNVIKQLAGVSKASMVLEADTGFVAIAKVVGNTYKIYEYTKDLKLVAVTPYDINALLEKYPGVSLSIE